MKVVINRRWHQFKGGDSQTPHGIPAQPRPWAGEIISSSDWEIIPSTESSDFAVPVSKSIPSRLMVGTTGSRRGNRRAQHCRIGEQGCHTSKSRWQRKPASVGWISSLCLSSGPLPSNSRHIHRRTTSGRRNVAKSSVSVSNDGSHWRATFIGRMNRGSIRPSVFSSQWHLSEFPMKRKKEKVPVVLAVYSLVFSLLYFTELC